jgi:NAD(P)-dependent dehydrogenase (short-subunit alcohol dehydrogenase family)
MRRPTQEVSMRLENKVALITGSTGGMGRASARLFAKEGATVVVTKRGTEGSDALRITARVELPVNIMISSGAPTLDELAAAGVRRLSQGGEGFLVVVGTLKLLADRYLAGELAAPPEALAEGLSLIKALLA